MRKPERWDLTPLVTITLRKNAKRICVSEVRDREALPLLDAMVPALTAQSRTAANGAFRFGAIYFPNGVWPDTWHPDTPGTNFLDGEAIALELGHPLALPAGGSKPTIAVIGPP